MTPAVDPHARHRKKMNKQNQLENQDHRYGYRQEDLRLLSFRLHPVSILSPSSEISQLAERGAAVFQNGEPELTADILHLQIWKSSE